jgi:hypothetical protein
MRGEDQRAENGGVSTGLFVTYCACADPTATAQLELR